jgi:hypothetical protein
MKKKGYQPLKKKLSLMAYFPTCSVKHSDLPKLCETYLLLVGNSECPCTHEEALDIVRAMSAYPNCMSCRERVLNTFPFRVPLGSQAVARSDNELDKSFRPNAVTPRQAIQRTASLLSSFARKSSSGPFLA